MSNENKDGSVPNESNDSKKEQQSPSTPNTVTSIVEKGLDITEE